MAYVNCVFYFNGQLAAVDKVAARIVERVSTQVTLPPGLLSAYLPPKKIDGRWTGSLPDDLYPGSKRLSADRLVDELNTTRSSPYCVMIESPRPGAKEKALDYVWSLHCLADAVPDDQTEVGCLGEAHGKGACIVFSFSDQSLSRQFFTNDGKVARAIVDAVVTVAGDIDNGASGFVERVPPDETLGCNMYSPFGISGFRTRAAYSEGLWWSQPAVVRRERVRGVSWGNFFGRELAMRLSEPTDAVEAFDKWTFVRFANTAPFRRSQYVRRLAKGGLFLAVSDDPLEWGSGSEGGGLCSGWDSPLLGLAVTLHNELRDRDMLV